MDIPFLPSHVLTFVFLLTVLIELKKKREVDRAKRAYTYKGEDGINK